MTASVSAPSSSFSGGDVTASVSAQSSSFSGGGVTASVSAPSSSFSGGDVTASVSAPSSSFSGGDVTASVSAPSSSLNSENVYYNSADSMYHGPGRIESLDEVCTSSSLYRFLLNAERYLHVQIPVDSRDTSTARRGLCREPTN